MSWIYNSEKDREGPKFGRSAIPDKVYSTLCRCSEDTKVKMNQKNPHTQSVIWKKKYNKYKHAKTFKDLLRLGANANEIQHDMMRGNIKPFGFFRKGVPKEIITPVDRMISNYRYRCDPKQLAKMYKYMPIIDKMSSKIAGCPHTINDVINTIENLGMNNFKDALSHHSGQVRSGYIIARIYVERLCQKMCAKNTPITHSIMTNLLNKWGYKQNFSRFNVMPDDVSWIHSDNIGILKDRISSYPRLTSTTRKYPNFFHVLCKYVKNYLDDMFFTSICLNKNYAAVRHVDKNNEGPSAIVALGPFKGGTLNIWKNKKDIGKPKEINIKQRFTIFDGNRPHSVNPYEDGDRYSIVYFTTRNYQKCERKDVNFIKKCTASYPTPEKIRCLQERCV